MYWRDVGYLCRERMTLDRFRKPQKSYEKRRVFCNVKSVRQSEFYQAQAAGYKPEAVFEIRATEYNGATHFEHGGRLLRIIRTYNRGGDTLELVCNSLIDAPKIGAGEPALEKEGGNNGPTH